MKTRLQQAFFNSSQGPQHREIGFPISTDNASWGVGPNTENFEKKFYRQCELGWDNQREIGFPISTDSASWGGTTIKKYFFYRN
ncbi:Nitrogen regulation protein NIFR3 [Staphylococcus aureus]|nr:Nitrogen regulation protein NIFR3 [Staphylococcus aureus]